MYKIKENCKYYYSEELKQKQAITEQLVHKILFSKRLLVDHVESLEEFLLDIGIANKNCSNAGVDAVAEKAKAGPLEEIKLKPDAKVEVFTLRNCSVLFGITALKRLLLPKSWRFLYIPTLIASGGFGTVCLVKSVFICRNKMVERQLEQLLKSIEEFGNCIRKHMTFYNERLVMKSIETLGSYETERAWDCISSIKTVTELLNEATHKLENEYPIPERFSKYYTPMEDLRECDYFKNNVTDYTPKNIKDFHNIFAYVQSQYLLRLALTIYTKPSLSQLNAELIKIEGLIRQLLQEETNHLTNLVIEQFKGTQMRLESLIETRTMKNRVGPVALMQDSSLHLSARMVAVASECQALDVTLHKLNAMELSSKNNGKHLVEIASNFRAIESSLAVCLDDFQRLMLVYNKFLHMVTEQDEKKSFVDKEQDNSSDDSSQSFLRVEISNNSTLDPVQNDDFYAYMFDGNKSKHEDDENIKRHDFDMEILNFEKNITKSRFRPVLKQLKDKINPIRKVMLEKERKVLTAKGIDVDELYKHLEPNNFDENDQDQEKEMEEEEQENVIHLKERKRSEIDAEEKDNDDLDTDDGSEGSADLMESQMKNKKAATKRDQFAEMRNFLANKQAINIINLGNPSAIPNAFGKEAILESDC